MYEERITLWRARDLDHAIELAEAEASKYSEDPSDTDQPIRYVKLAQAYQLVDQPGSGAEVFSLIRDSDLDPQDYLSRYFDTGNEHQQDV